MGYLLRIWENAANLALPQTVDEAEARLLALRDVRTEQNPKFIELAQRLVQQFPYPNEDGDDDDEATSDKMAWSDWPLDGETDNEPVWNLGVNTYLLETVRAAVMQEANALGLCVMDEQAGEVYLPGNRVLCLPGRTPYVVSKNQEEDAVPKNSEFLDRIFQHLEPMLAERGYKGRKRDRSFRRKFPMGWHELWVFAPAQYSICALAEVMIKARFEPITGLRIAITEPDISPRDADSKTTLLGKQERWMENDGPFLSHNKAYEITRHGEIDIVLDHLCRILRERVLPALEACTTIGAVDRALNPPPGSESFFRGYQDGIDHILAAYLARNPRLEEISMEYKSRRIWEPHARKFIDNPKTLACLEYISNHPLPPVDE